MKSAAEIVLVISNKAGVKGLDRAQAVGINTKVLKHHKGIQALLQTAGTHTKVHQFYSKLQAFTQHKGPQASLQTAGIHTNVHRLHTTQRYTQRYTGFTANCSFSHS